MIEDTRYNNRYIITTSLIVALGGFLFGFDAAVISGAVGLFEIDLNLSVLEKGFAVSCLTLASTIAMAFAGPLSDRFGRKKVLSSAALMYAVSAGLSALAPNYAILVGARMIGGAAVGFSLILAPMYIAEIAPAKVRGKMVSFNQLNIVLGFSVAYFSNYFLFFLAKSDIGWVQSLGIDDQTWRWMLGLETVPAILYFLGLFLVPESPRWLMMNKRKEEALGILEKANGKDAAKMELQAMEKSISEVSKASKASLKDLFVPALSLVLTIGLVVGILQQITGINAVFFYANDIFELSGVGKDASFTQAIWIGLINVVATVIAMQLIDRVGRRPLLLFGVAGIVVSMFLISYQFHQATYTLSPSAIESLSNEIGPDVLNSLSGITYDTDVAFTKALEETLSVEQLKIHKSALLKAGAKINPLWILIGILGFVASFAISLGPVMWVLFSEIFPNNIRGIAISFVGFVNSAVSWLVQQFFPWELKVLGNSMTFLIYGIFALIGFVLIYRLLPETKGKSLEELEGMLRK